MLGDAFLLLSVFNSWRTPLALNLGNHAFLTFAQLTFDSWALFFERLSLGVICYLILHVSQTFSVLIDSFYLIVEFLLLLQISHFVTISLILEIFGSILFGKERLPEFTNFFHDV